MISIGIDPGPEKSAVVEFNGLEVRSAQYLPNETIREGYAILRRSGILGKLAIEFPESRGMPIAQSVLDTADWAGTFNRDRTGRFFHPRDVRIHLCGTAEAKRKNVNQALVDRLGPVGTAKAHGPLWQIAGYGVHKGEQSDDEESVTEHLWDALAVAVMGWDLAQERVPV
jgi:hypothetical protein